MTTRAAADLACSGPHDASQGFDLGHATVVRTPTGYTIDASYTGDPTGHDVLVRFDAGPGTYLIDAEMFEDGGGTARVEDPGTADDVFLEGAQTVAPGRISLVVASDLMPGLAAAATFTASLAVDGALVENCSS